jgi:hypothetical protein
MLRVPHSPVLLLAEVSRWDTQREIGTFGHFALFLFISSISTHSSDFVYISPRRMYAPNTALQGKS